MESLCQQFPSAPALEQAGCYRRGSVSTANESASTASSLDTPTAPSPTGLRRSKRAAQPSKMYTGDQ